MNNYLPNLTATDKSRNLTAVFRMKAYKRLCKVQLRRNGMCESS